MTDLDVVGLYEEMLCERAARGIRPMLYISSSTDFECGVIMLLDNALEKNSTERHQPPAPEFRQHIRKV